MQSAPMDAGAADPFARQECADAANGKPLFVREIAEGQRVDRIVPHQFETLRPPEFIAHGRNSEILTGNAVLSLFQRDHIQTGFGQFARHDRGSPAKADRDDVDFF